MQFGTREQGSLIDEDLLLKKSYMVGSNLWSPLQLYSVYRVILAGILFIFGLTKFSSAQFGAANDTIFSLSVNTYIFLTVLGFFLTHFRKPNFVSQLYLHAIVDIAFLLIVVYVNGGLSPGLGILFLMPVLLPSILQPSQYSLLLSAGSVVLLLGMETFIIPHTGDSTTFDMFNTGVLSFFILMTSWLAGTWFEKASETAALAKSRGIDLANLSQLNQSILDQLQTGIIVLDKNTGIRLVNPTAWEMLGKPQDWQDKMLSIYAPELSAHLKYWLENVSPKVASYDIKHWKGTEFSMRLSQLGVKDEGIVLLYIEDTRVQRGKQQDVKMASLGQLTANIAHEIRNPLGAISHAAQLLSESPLLDKADERMIQIIQSNSKRMNGTIQSVLNLSRKNTPQRENIRLKHWLNEFVKEFAEQSSLTRKQINIFVDIPQAQIQFDPTHLHQVLWNLCRNAEKYAKKNVQDLHIDIQGNHPAHTRDIMLNIIDNGKGVSAQHIERLFEPFFTTSVKGSDGTGLGLFMARELCLSNGASLEYVKLPSGGSCFRIIFSQSKLRH